MSEKFHWILIFCFVVFICTITACVSEQGTTNEMMGSGAQPIKESKVTQNTNLDNVFYEIDVMNSERANESARFRIFSITGFRPDNQGYSESWLIVGIEENKSEYIEYHYNTLSFNPWHGNLPYTEITKDSVMSPNDLFRKHQARLNEYRSAGWTQERIDLKEDLYNLTLVKNSETKLFTFNAKSGEFIGWI